MTLLAGALVLGATLASRRRHWSDFRGRVVLITGGSRGLGLVLARRFGSLGARVALCARDADKLEIARRELAARGVDVLAVPCDLTDQENISEMVRAVLDRFGRIDVLVNNAGVIQVGPMDSMMFPDHHEAMDVHYWGPLYTTRAVLPQMRARGDGRIVNIASIGGKVAVPHMIPYDASKFALVGLSEALRAELLQEGVFVTTVCPWLMRTGSTRNALFKGQNEKEHTWFSIASSLPGVTISAETAARRIVEACRKGSAEVFLSAQGRLVSSFHGLFPGLTANLMGLMNRVLPAPGGIGREMRLGEMSRTPLSESVLTALGRRAALRNNEI